MNELQRESMNNMTEATNSQSSAILKELSDIKASLAVNTNETGNIKASITEIKLDIKEIKSDFVNRREFSEKNKEIDEKLKGMDYENRIKWLERIAYGFIGVITAVEFYYKFLQK